MPDVRLQGIVAAELNCRPATGSSGAMDSRFLLVANAAGGVDVISPCRLTEVAGPRVGEGAVIMEGHAERSLQPVPRWVVRTSSDEDHWREPSVLFPCVPVDNIRYVPGAAPGEGWMYIAAAGPARIIRVREHELLSSRSATQNAKAPDPRHRLNKRGSGLCAAEAIAASSAIPGRLELYPCLDDPEGFQIAGDRLFVCIADLKSVTFPLSAAACVPRSAASSTRDHTTTAKQQSANADPPPPSPLFFLGGRPCQ